MTDNFKLAPSILSADFSDLQSALKICDRGNAHWIHVDVMDNQFVPNLTIGPPVVKSLRPKTQKFIDVHMMVIHPEKLSFFSGYVCSHKVMNDIFRSTLKVSICQKKKFLTGSGNSF